jgi:DNA-binding MarR family transcriptional regulator
MAPLRPIGYWLKLVDRLLDEQFIETMEEHGITRRQWQMMNLLADKPSTAGELAEALGPFIPEEEGEGPQEPVEELVESGWVSAENGHYALTDTGRASLASLGEVVDRTRARMADGISEEEYAATLDVLERIARNLGWEG